MIMKKDTILVGNKKDYPDINVSKLKKLFNSTGLPLYKLAKGIAISQQTLERLLRGERVGLRVLADIAYYFQLNISDLTIKNSEEKKFKGKFEDRDIVFLNRINSFNELYKNLDYMDSRLFSKFKNSISHKLYYCELKDDDQLARIKNFLSAFTDISALSPGTTKTNDLDDVLQEISFLKKQININKPIEDLADKNIGVYYGHYFYRAMDVSSYKDTQNFSPDSLREPNITNYRYVRPSGKRIEVLCFFEKSEYPGLPEQVKIFPETGFTEDDLVDKYFRAFDKYFGIDPSKSSQERVLLKDYINYHKKSQWLLVEDKPENEESMTNPENGFLHPYCFIYSTPDKVVAKSDFKTEDAYENYKRKLKLFPEIIDNFEYKFFDDSFLKYDGPIEEVNLKSGGIASIKISKAPEQKQEGESN